MDATKRCYGSPTAVAEISNFFTDHRAGNTVPRQSEVNLNIQMAGCPSTEARETVCRELQQTGKASKLSHNGTFV
jgi:hypothetical protein